MEEQSLKCTSNFRFFPGSNIFKPYTGDTLERLNCSLKGLILLPMKSMAKHPLTTKEEDQAIIAKLVYIATAAVLSV